MLLAIVLPVMAQSQYGKADFSDNVSGVVTEIAFYTPDIVNVRHYKADGKVPKQSLVVTLAKQNCEVSRSEADGVTTLSSRSLKVVFDASTGCVSFYDLQGGLLLTEKDGTTTLTARKDGDFDSYKVSQSFKAQSGERLYGLGQLQNGNWNQRNKRYDYMIQGNTSEWIPYLHSSKGYGLYWDNASPTSYRNSGATTTFESAVGYGVDYFFLLGSTTDGQIDVQRMRQLSGQVPMLPLWAYGFFQSKERYESANETMGVVSRYRQLQVPLDCVVQDWQYWGTNNYWNAMEFRSSKFSNYQQMIDSIHHNHAHLLVSAWANFGRDTKRVFEVVLVQPGQGTADTLSATVNARVRYDGNAQTVTIDPLRNVDTLMPDDRSTADDGTKPYRFHVADWRTGDAGRVPQANITYDESANTITLHAQGRQNAALQLDGSLSGKYYALHAKPYFCVTASGVTANAADQQLWFAYGNHVGTMTPGQVISLNDSTWLYAWNLADVLPKAVTVDLVKKDLFIFCFGMTPTAAKQVVVSDINFYDESYLNKVSTNIVCVENDSHAHHGKGWFNLTGQRIAYPAKGLYIYNGKKYIKK